MESNINNNSTSETSSVNEAETEEQVEVINAEAEKEIQELQQETIAEPICKISKKNEYKTDQSDILNACDTKLKDTISQLPPILNSKDFNGINYEPPIYQLKGNVTNELRCNPNLIQPLWLKQGSHSFDERILKLEQEAERSKHIQVKDVVLIAWNVAITTVLIMLLAGKH